MRPFATALLATLTLLPLPSAIPAHTLVAPDSVVANPDGSFSFNAVFTAGPGSTIVGGYSWFGLENVAAGLFVDCFCSPGCPVGEGEQIVIPVYSSLLDPELPGLAFIEVILCSEPALQVETRILPLKGTAVRRATWSQIKVLYR